MEVKVEGALRANPDISQPQSSLTQQCKVVN